MKIQLAEHEGCFSFDLQAESMEDAAIITRLGVNATKEVRSIGAFVSKSGEFSGSIVIGKHRKSDGQIPRRK